MLTCTKIGTARVLRDDGVTSRIKVATGEDSDSQTLGDLCRQRLGPVLRLTQ